MGFSIQKRRSAILVGIILLLIAYSVLFFGRLLIRTLAPYLLIAFVWLSLLYTAFRILSPQEAVTRKEFLKISWRIIHSKLYYQNVLYFHFEEKDKTAPLWFRCLYRTSDVVVIHMQNGYIERLTLDDPPLFCLMLEKKGCIKKQA